MIKKNKTKIILLLLTLVVLAGAGARLARATENSRVYFDPETLSIAPQSEFTVSVLVDAHEPINALDLQVVYPASKLEFLSFDNTHSIIDFWQGDPTLLSKGHIKLTGGMMKPFGGAQGFVIKIAFKALGAGEAKVSFERNDLYLADGKGTKIKAETTLTTLSILEKAENVSRIEPSSLPADTTPPNIFLELSHDPVSGSPLLIFSATDKESGIKSTEVRFKKWLAWSSWASVQNPTLYPSGAWQVELRATNNDNLIMSKSLSLPGKLFEKLSIPILIIFFVLLLLAVYNKRKHLR